MTRFTHSILFFFAIAMALLCSAVLMMFLSETWVDAGFVALVASALLLALLVPGVAALASRRYIKWRQPLTAWVVFYVITLLITLGVGSRLLG